MSKIVVLRKQQLTLFAVLAIVIVLAVAYLRWEPSMTASGEAQMERIIHLVTVEHKSTMDDGKELEVYRWDPGTIVVQRGEKVQLNITGVNGKSHPFVIEGLNVRGEVTKGKTSVVRFTAEKPGTYPILCLTHTQLSDGGPMVGYIEVQ